MKLDDLQALAAYHKTKGDETHAAALSTDNNEVSRRLDAKAAWHFRMAAQLTELAEAFQHFTKAITL